MTAWHNEESHLLIFVILYVAIAMTINAQKIPPKQTLSEVDNSEINFLTSRIQELKDATDSWNTAYLWLVFAAVVVTTATFLSQVGRIKKGNELSSAQGELIRAKDRQLASDLGEKDSKISAANERAGVANKSAAELRERAAKLEIQAADARREQEKLAIAAENLRQGNISAAARLEEEKGKRIALAVSLLPRNFRDQSGAIQSLKLHAGITAIFEVREQDDEPLETAQQIHLVLSMASWKLVKQPPNGVFREGILIHPGVTRIPPPPALPTPDDMALSNAALRDTRETRAAAEVLRDILIASGIEAALGYPELVTRSVIIRVGRKPNRELEQALRDLGNAPTPTPVNGVAMGGNKSWFN